MRETGHSALEKALLNDFQRDFPLCPQPFRVVAERLGAEEGEVLSALGRLRNAGSVSRVGPVFRPNTVGASTLAAVSAPASRLEAVADCISAFPEVNHNYEREHRFNLWFVVNAASEARRDAVLAEISAGTGLEVMSLPLVRDYYIDLGFDLDFGAAGGGARRAARAPDRTARNVEARDAGHVDLVRALQRGLPLVRAPYAAVGERAGMPEPAVIEQIRRMLRAGTIKRFGVVVRHHELGYRANAMCVWDVAGDGIDELGRRLAEVPFVTLCYQRPRRLPHWPYNLFCMIHGKHRRAVLAQVDQLNHEFELADVPSAVLFSGRRFKQRGAVFSTPCRSTSDFGQAAHG